uniref:DNA-directed RNA polymerase n=1 Tax=viral metagenome TaxID=1070528 RepID=A0A6C0BDD9_9ZZZZ
MQFDTQRMQTRIMPSLDLKLTDENKAYQMALHYNRSCAVNEYNHMIDTIIPGILVRNFDTKDGNRIKVKGVDIKFPQVTSEDGNSLMTPFTSKMTGTTYKAEVWIDYVEIKNITQTGSYSTQTQGLIDDKVKTRKIGSFHVLVGSNRCITSVKPDEFRTLDEWKMFLCECPASPGAYILHKGAEKSVILDEKLRTNCYLTFMTKGENPTIETRITCMDNSLTSLVRVRIGSHRPCIKILFPHLKGKHYPLYLTFYLLYFAHNTKEANKATFKLNYFEELIASFATPELHDAVVAYLKPSKSKFIELFTTFTQSGSMDVDDKKVQSYIIDKLNNVNSSFSKEDDANKFALITACHSVPDELFNQCKTYSGKIANLAFVTCQTILCGLLRRDFDGRDGWDMKKVDSLVRQITSYVRTTLVNAIISDKPDNVGFNFGKSDRKETIVEARKCETLNAAIAERDKIDNQVDTRTNSLTLRKVDQTQFPIVCPPKTPEGESCGLSKEKSALSYISHNQEYALNRKQVFNDLFEPNILYFSTVKTNVFKYRLATSNLSGNTQFVHHGTDHTNISPNNIFFSLRIIDLFKSQFKANEAIYFIDGDLENILIKFMIPTHQPRQFSFQTYTGGNIYICLPDYLLPQFDIVTKITKNPSYNSYSSLHKTDDCKLRIMFKKPGTNPQFSYVMYSNGSYNELYISELFVEDIRLVVGQKGTVEIVDEICIVTIDGSYNQFTCIHWTGNKIVTMLPKSFSEIYEMLTSNVTEFISLKRSTKYSFSLMFNGNVIDYDNKDTFYPTVVWTDGPKILEFLKNKRRNGELPYDSCIYFNTKDSSVQYFDDSGRLMAPLLVVDEDSDLKIDKSESWKYFSNRDLQNSNVYIEKLYNEGSVDLIDSKEMDTILMARSIEEARNFSKLRKFLNKIDFNSLNSSIYKDESKYFKNEDMSVVIIRGNSFDLEFTEKPPVEDSLTFVQDGITYYGTYTFQKSQLRSPSIKYFKLVKPADPILRDGYYLLYKYDDEYRFVTKTSDEETDGDNVYIGDIAYKIHYFEYPEYRGYSYVNEDLKIVDFIDLERPTIVSSSTDNKNLYYRCDNNWIDPSLIIDKYFVKINNEYKVITEVFFEGDNNVFELTSVKINEYIPSYITTYQKYDEEKYINDGLEKNECDLHIISIRRSIDELNKINLDNQNYFEMLSSMKEMIPLFGNKRIMLNIRKYINTTFRFTHCLIDPNAAFSVIANFVPKADSNPGPRWSYQCSMGTQALGVGNSVWYRRYETTTKRLIAPTEHSFETIAELPYSQITMPTTQNFIFGVLAHRKTFEDPVIISVNCIKKFGRYVKEITIKIIETSINGCTEIVCRPIDEMGNIKTKTEYRHLDGYGLPKLGSYIKVKDCIVGRTKSYSESPKKIDSSYFAGIGEDGLVSSIQIVGSEGSEGAFRTIYIKLVQVRYQQPGDKLAARFSQKGTIADLVEGMINDGDERLRIVDDNLMPYVLAGPNAGLRVEIVFNPASFPSRMTCGLIKEVITAKAAVYLQEKVNASNFHHLDMEYYNDSLYSNKLLDEHLDCNANEFLCHSDGEIMIDHSTGLPFQVFIGIVAYQFLRHQVEDKKQSRATGPIKPITHQPVEGKKNGGGARMGEMERDSLISSGGSETLYDRFMEGSDGFVDVFCIYCKNNSAISNLHRNICSVCRTSGSLVSVKEPRIYKVFIHQMSAIGLNIKCDFIPTDDFQNDVYKENIKAIKENENISGEF